MRVYIGFGSNADAALHLPAGCAYLAAQVPVMAVSRVYETPAAGHSGAAYLNAAVCIETDLPLPAIKALLIAIEDACGRVRRNAAGEKSTSVTLDLDILLAEGLRGYTFSGKQYTLPHPELEKYVHVILPLADIAPELVHPVSGRTISEMAARWHDLAVTVREDIVLMGVG